MDKKPLFVSCGILQQGDKILALRRKGEKELGGKWEFPGGKLEPGETPERCLERELKEELGLQVTIRNALPPVHHTYPHRTIVLYPYVCYSLSDIGSMKDHDAFIWGIPEQLRSLDWAEADLLVLEAYIHQRSNHS
ncbi:MAG: (deoxy)nucleoside triphosphate pyrophosphohydrolase [Spirochaetes bacterium]|nr:(deoxy)nucleoside triphosphate pyrophosphohydrolase [Spirochaetota bacterium]